jgi:hypothetical protein
MKTLRFLMFLVLVSISSLALAQSDAQTSFDKMKALSGSWEGTLSTIPPDPQFQGKAVHVTLRTTSMGNALLHEMNVAGRPDDPITMFYLNDDRLTLTHYCDAGNRPRMTGKMLPDGKTIDFEFLDVVGNMQYGHMHHADFTFIDANHHVEEWTFMVGEKPVRAHFDLQRVK